METGAQNERNTVSGILLEGDTQNNKKKVKHRSKANKRNVVVELRSSVQFISRSDTK